MNGTYLKTRVVSVRYKTTLFYISSWEVRMRLLRLEGAKEGAREKHFLIQRKLSKGKDNQSYLSRKRL